MKTEKILRAEHLHWQLLEQFKDQPAIRNYVDNLVSEMVNLLKSGEVQYDIGRKEQKEVDDKEFAIELSTSRLELIKELREKVEEKAYIPELGSNQKWTGRPTKVVSLQEVNEVLNSITNEE